MEQRAWEATTMITYTLRNKSKTIQDLNHIMACGSLYAVYTSRCIGINSKHNISERTNTQRSKEEHLQYAYIEQNSCHADDEVLKQYRTFVPVKSYRDVKW